MNYDIISPFAPNIFTFKLNNDHTKTFEQIKSDTKFLQHSGGNCYTSSDFYVLNNYEKLKLDIQNSFDFLKNNILKYESTQFKITTSWITKVRPGGMSHYHNHKNCMYSGVLYFDDLKNCAPIEFSNSNLYQDSFLLNQPSEVNIYNSNTWAIHPSKNTIIFFPSYLMHRVGYHGSEQSRYSLAFNFMPDGIYGSSDSTMRVEIF
jgi:uncharacterized protein (TIGR02466 family)